MKLGSIYIIRSRDQRTIQGMETQWFPESKEVQDAEVITSRQTEAAAVLEMSRQVFERNIVYDSASPHKMAITNQKIGRSTL
jgi:hypothetical protein